MSIVYSVIRADQCCGMVSHPRGTSSLKILVLIFHLSIFIFFLTNTGIIHGDPQEYRTIEQI